MNVGLIRHFLNEPGLQMRPGSIWTNIGFGLLLQSFTFQTTLSSSLLYSKRKLSRFSYSLLLSLFILQFIFFDS